MDAQTLYETLRQLSLVEDPFVKFADLGQNKKNYYKLAARYLTPQSPRTTAELVARAAHRMDEAEWASADLIWRKVVTGEVQRLIDEGEIIDPNKPLVKLEPDSGVIATYDEPFDRWVSVNANSFLTYNNEEVASWETIYTGR